MVTVKNSFSVNVLAMAFGLSVFVGLSGCSEEKMVETTAEQNEALLSRIKPVVTLSDIQGKVGKAEATVQAAPAADSSTQAVEKTTAAAPEAGTDAAMKLYNGACMACHSTGAAGAPKLGDKVAWEPRAATGMDAMMSTAKIGKGAMPPNGGSAYSEAQMRQVIEYMLAEAGLQI